MTSVSYVDYKGKMFLRGVSCLHLFPPILYIYSGTPPALQSLPYYGQLCLSQRNAHTFSLKLTRLIRTPVNTENGHFSVS